MTITTYSAPIHSHSPYYPTHSPRHRPVPFGHIVFPPDLPHDQSNAGSHPQTNPTHGQKVTTDLAGRRDPKLENSGPVPGDSLAAESTNHGGAFSAGNPTGISSARGSSGTFAADPGEGGNVRTIRGKQESTLDAGHPGKEVRESAKETSISGGGSQAQESFNVSPDDLESTDATGRKMRASKHAGGGSGGGGGGLGASKYAGGGGTSEAEGRGSRHTGGSGSNAQPQAKNVVPNTARSQETLEEGLDWSQVSKDTVPNTDIGGPDDPSRVAERHMAGQARRRDQGLGHTSGKMSSDNENSFDVLNDSSRAPETENPSRS